MRFNVKKFNAWKVFEIKHCGEYIKIKILRIQLIALIAHNKKNYTGLHQAFIVIQLIHIVGIMFKVGGDLLLMKLMLIDIIFLVTFNFYHQQTASFAMFYWKYDLLIPNIKVFDNQKIRL